MMNKTLGRSSAALAGNDIHATENHAEPIINRRNFYRRMTG
jgi:hypothetical protein